MFALKMSKKCFTPFVSSYELFSNICEIHNVTAHVVAYRLTVAHCLNSFNAVSSSEAAYTGGLLV